MALYLDHNATTPLHADALKAMLPWLESHFGNSSSVHQFGRQARKALDEARSHVAALIGASPEEIFFTGSGTEADNLAVKGIARALRCRGTHLVTSAIEHHAVLHSMRALKDEGFSITAAGVDRQCKVNPDEVLAAVTDSTVLVTIMHANNETGAIQPIERIGAQLRERGIPFHTDAVQSAGKLPIDVKQMPVDLLTLSSHKIQGPKGVGALYIRKGTPMPKPVIDGGGQESGIRAGTVNVAGIVGFGAAALHAAKTLSDSAPYLAYMRDYLEDGIRRIAPDALILTDRAGRLPNTVAVCFPNQAEGHLVERLDQRGFAVSSGAACTADRTEPSHVLTAMGIEPSLARGSLRFSLGTEITEYDIDEVLKALKSVLKSDPKPVSLLSPIEALKEFARGGKKR